MAHPLESSDSAGRLSSWHPSRRHILNWLAWGTLSLWGIGAVGVIGAYLQPLHPGEQAAERTVSAGSMDDLQVGDSYLVRHGTSPFFIIRMNAEQVVALSAVCTHLRCILKYDRESRTLVCPCHDGRFDLTGSVLSGPPLRPLPSYRVSVRAGEILVHL